jgi:hypothetical protein
MIRRSLESLSIRALLAGAMGVLAFFLLAFGTDLAWRGWSRHAEAERIVKTAEAGRELFRAAAATRLERGETMTALAAPAPDPEGSRIRPRNAEAEAATTAALAALRGMGLTEKARQVEASLAPVTELRVAVDAAPAARAAPAGSAPALGRGQPRACLQPARHHRGHGEPRPRRRSGRGPAHRHAARRLDARAVHRRPACAPRARRRAPGRGFWPARRPPRP